MAAVLGGSAGALETWLLRRRFYQTLSAPRLLSIIPVVDALLQIVAALCDSCHGAMEGALGVGERAAALRVFLQEPRSTRRV